jgi:Protein of unknown function DUF86
LDGVTLEAFEQNWEKRWLVERGIEVISEASRHLTDDIKERRIEIPWSKVAGIGNVLRHAYDHVAPDDRYDLKSGYCDFRLITGNFESGGIRQRNCQFSPASTRTASAEIRPAAG